MSKADLKALRAAPTPPRLTPELARQARTIIAALDERGAWLEPIRLRAYPKVNPVGGVIRSQTFADNVAVLCRFLRAR